MNRFSSRASLCVLTVGEPWRYSIRMLEPHLQYASSSICGKNKSYYFTTQLRRNKHNKFRLSVPAAPNQTNFSKKGCGRYPCQRVRTCVRAAMWWLGVFHSRHIRTCVRVFHSHLAMDWCKHNRLSSRLIKVPGLGRHCLRHGGRIGCRHVKSEWVK